MTAHLAVMENNIPRKVAQNLRNSSVVYDQKTKNPFGAKTCMNISFQLLLHIMKVKSQEDQKFCSLNFSDVMSKPAMPFRSQASSRIFLSD